MPIFWKGKNISLFFNLIGNGVPNIIHIAFECVIMEIVRTNW